MNDVDYLRSAKIDEASVNQNSMIAFIMGGLVALADSQSQWQRPITAADLAGVVRFAETCSKKVQIED